MNTYNNVVIVYPGDPTIEFLSPIVDLLKQIFPKAVISNPPVGTYSDDITDETDLVIFLGHGSPSFLYGRLNESGQKSMYMDINTARRMFEGITVILFSCNSWDFLKRFRVLAKIDNYVSFGDMPTDWDHIEHNRKTDANFLIDFQDEHLKFYKLCLVEAMILGFKAAHICNSLVSIPHHISLFVSVKINHVIFNESWTKSQKLQMIQLLIRFKKEVRYAQSLAYK